MSDPMSACELDAVTTHKGIPITVKKCPQCHGSGHVADKALIKAMQRGIDRGEIDFDDLMAIAVLVRARLGE